MGLFPPPPSVIFLILGLNPRRLCYFEISLAWNEGKFLKPKTKPGYLTDILDKHPLIFQKLMGYIFIQLPGR